MKVSDMHKMRLQAKHASRQIKKTPMIKDIERYRTEMIEQVLGETKKIIQQQINIALLPVREYGEDNMEILKASNSLLDRVFGKPKESIDFTGDVKFSLRALSKAADDEDDETSSDDNDKSEDDETLFIKPDEE